MDLRVCSGLQRAFRLLHSRLLRKGLSRGAKFLISDQRSSLLCCMMKYDEKVRWSWCLVGTSGVNVMKLFCP